MARRFLNPFLFVVLLSFISLLTVQLVRVGLFEKNVWQDLYVLIVGIPTALAIAHYQESRQHEKQAALRRSQLEHLWMHLGEVEVEIKVLLRDLPSPDLSRVSFHTELLQNFAFDSGETAMSRRIAQIAGGLAANLNQINESLEMRYEQAIGSKERFESNEQIHYLIKMFLYSLHNFRKVIRKEWRCMGGEGELQQSQAEIP